MRSFTTYKKYLPFALAAVFFASVVFSQVYAVDLLGLAEVVDGIAATVRGWIVWLASIPAFIIQGLAYLLSWVAGFFVNIMVDLNLHVLSSEFVLTGYKITLALANLILVVLLITIAVATILRMGQYQAKSMLWRVILIAFLINFGLAIAGIFIDASNILGKFFLDPFENRYADGLLATMNPQRTMVGIQKGATVAEAVSGMIGELILNYLRAFVFLFAAIMLLIVGAVLFMRYLHLLFLLALLPLAWTGQYLPKGLGAEAAKWWDKFLNWIITFPILAMFLYLSVYVFTAANDPTGFNKLAKPNLAASGMTSNITTSEYGPIFETIVMVLGSGGLMIAGLVAAQSLGASAAGMGLAASNRLKAAALGLGAAPFKAGGRYFEEQTRGLREKMASGLMKTGTAGRLFGLQTAGAAMQRGVRSAEEKQMESLRGTLKGMSASQIREFKPLTETERAVRAEALLKTKDGWKEFESLSDTEKRDYITSLEKKGLDKEFKQKRPDAFIKYGTSTVDRLIKETKPADVLRWDAKVLEDPTILTALSPEMESMITKKGTVRHKEALAKGYVNKLEKERENAHTQLNIATPFASSGQVIESVTNMLKPTAPQQLLSTADIQKKSIAEISEMELEYQKAISQLEKAMPSLKEFDKYASKPAMLRQLEEKIGKDKLDKFLALQKNYQLAKEDRAKRMKAATLPAQTVTKPPFPPGPAGPTA